MSSLETKNECVVFLHGLGRMKSSMWRLQHHFKKLGYDTLNQGYPSTHLSIEAIAQKYVHKAITQCQSQSKIHFVTHSLGAIVLRQYLQTHRLPEGSRIVMLAPPNQGSEMAAKLKSIFLFQWLTGKAGQQVAKTTQSIVHQFKPITAEVGIIAGNTSWIPFISYLLTGDDDGIVTIEETKLTEMTDHIIVAHSHSFIMNFNEVIRQTQSFIQNGHFDE